MLRILFICIPSVLLLIGCGGNLTTQVRRLDLSYPTPSPLISPSNDPSGWKFGGAVSLNPGPDLIGTTRETTSGSGSEETKVIPASRNNLRIHFEDMATGLYFTYSRERFTANFSGEMSDIHGDVFHRYDGSIWGRYGAGNVVSKAGIGVSVFDVYHSYAVDRYAYDAGEYSSNYLGSDSASGSRNFVAPYFGISLGYLAFDRLQIGFSVSRYLPAVFSSLGAGHRDTPLSISFCPKIPGGIVPVLMVTYLMNEAGGPAGHFKTTLGSEY